MVSMPQRIQVLIPVMLVISFLLAACGTATPASIQPPTENPTPAATATSTVAPGTLVYVTSAPADADPYAALISEFAATNTLQYVSSTVLDASVLSPETRIVILQSPPADLGTLVDAHPDIQFILLGSSELTARPNLSTLSARSEDVYFLAGYLSTLIAYDWRSAGLVVGTGEAFYNGGKYVCGKCNPSYPPVVDLPQITALPGTATSAEWLAAANAMLVNGVNVMFVDAPAATPEILSTAISMQAVLVGLTSPPAGTEANWAATLTSDATGALEQLLVEVMEGAGGKNIVVPVTLVNVNPDLVSPGRQDLFNQVAAMVAAGEIGTQSIP